MSTAFHIILFMYLIIKTSALIYNKQELTIILEFSKKLNINTCVFVEEENEKTNIYLRDDLRYFDNASIYFMVLNYHELIRIMHHTTDTYDRVLIVLKRKTSEIEKMLEHFKKSEIIHQMHRYIWLVFEKDYRITNKTNLSIPYDCQFIIVESINGSSYTLTEIFELESNHFFSNFGIWEHKKGLNIDEKFIYLRRQNLNKTKISLLYDWKPFNRVELSSYELEPIKVVKAISWIMNLQLIQVILPYENYTSRKLIVNKLRGHVFIYAGQAFLLADIHLNITMNPLFRTRINWYIKQPQMELKPNFYLKPFDKNFRLILTSLTVAGTVFVLVIRHVRKNGKETKTDDLFLVLTYFCNQNGSNELTKASERITSLSFRWTGFILLSSFGAVITSYNTPQPAEIPFTDLATFYKSDGYVLPTSFLSHLLGAAERKKLFDENRIVDTSELINFEDLENFNDGDPDDTEFINRLLVCQKKVAIPGLEIQVYWENVACNVYQIDEPIGYAWNVIEISPNNPLRGTFNYYLLRLHESGILHRVEKNVRFSPPKKSEGDKFKPIELQSMKGILMMPVVGIIIGTLIIVSEYSYNKLQACSKFKKQIFKSHKLAWF